MEADGGEEDQIDKANMEIKQAEDEVYSNMQQLSDELPDNSPRYILLSYPLTMVCRGTWDDIEMSGVVCRADTFRRTQDACQCRM